MIEIEGVPKPRPLPSQARRAQRVMLESALRRPERRRQWTARSVAAGVGAIALLGGGAVATAYVAFAPVTDKNSVRCYSEASLQGGDRHFHGTEISVAGPAGPERIEKAVLACSWAWRDGIVVAGASTARSPEQPLVAHSVPNLVACTLKNGTAGVFPGDSRTCARLGLPQAKE